MKQVLHYLKRDVVLSAALLLALVSSFLVTPDEAYLSYIDYRTLGILFCLMSVMAGFRQLGLFRYIAEGMLKRVKSLPSLILILTMLCFFFSMLITNDVALITFVPLTFTVLTLMGEEKKALLAIPVVVLQTIAANLGSMLTPIGNPQNLYLYTLSGLSLGQFLALMLPYTLLSFLLLSIWCLYLGLHLGKGKKRKLSLSMDNQTSLSGKGKELAFYLLLFLLCLLTVAHLMEWYLTFVILLLLILFTRPALLKQVDYALLLTFAGFFVFIGNMGRIPAFCDFLSGILQGREVITAILASQVISNVPAALLLSGFTDEISALIIGTNLGGLGTLIASMASLISYKYIAAEMPEKKGPYFRYFTIGNGAFLLALVLLFVLIK